MSSPAVARVDHRAPRYVEDVIRASVVLTMFWGIVAFLAGVVIALPVAVRLGEPLTFRPWRRGAPIVIV